MKQISEKYVREWHERGKFGTPELSQPEKDSLANLEANLRVHQADIIRLQVSLATAQSKIDGHATQ
jgi:hypothetical protein